MKKLSLIFLVIPLIIWSQEDTKKEEDMHTSFTEVWNNSEPVRFGVRLSGQGFISKKDQFINDIYSLNIGYNIGGRMYLKSLLGFGLDYSYNNANVDQRDLVGPFATAKFNNWIYYTFLRFPLSKMAFLEGKLGGSELNINHEFRDARYQLSYSAFIVGAAIYIGMPYANESELFFSIDRYQYKPVSGQENPADYKKFFGKTSSFNVAMGINLIF